MYRKNPSNFKIEQVTPSQVSTLAVAIWELAAKYPDKNDFRISCDIEKNFETAFELLTDCAARLTAEIRSETRKEAND